MFFKHQNIIIYAGQILLSYSLLQAVEGNLLDSVKRLCEAVCDLFVKLHDGFTAMECALQRGDNCLGIIKYLHGSVVKLAECNEEGIRRQLHDFRDYKTQPRKKKKMYLLHRVFVAKKDIPVASTLEFIINEGEEINFTEDKLCRRHACRFRLSKCDIVCRVRFGVTMSTLLPHLNFSPLVTSLGLFSLLRRQNLVNLMALEGFSC